MSPVYDLYQPGRSWLHRVDPRVKLAFVLCASLCLLVTVNLWLILAMLVLMHVLLLSAGVSLSRIGGVWRVVLPTVLLIAILWVLLNPTSGRAWVIWGAHDGVRIGPLNLAHGLAIGLRIAALALAVFVWLYTTDAGSLVLSLVALGLPYTWGLTAGMALRYLPTMAGVFRSISEAQQARSLDLHAGGLVQRARAYIPISVAMLISALRTAQSVSYGLESRALGATPRRTYLHRLHVRSVDVVYALAILLVTAGYLGARVAYGLGAHPLGLLD
ncbi:MAG: energy-coupling factor transporter transmembrane component T family protein [Anaerolineae bacterium]